MSDLPILDARGLNCPLPLLKMKVALKDLQENDKIMVLTSDKASLRDFKSFCDLSNNELLSSVSKASYFEFVIQKG
jgi:tRNA 2-thiouridine synthesizing protein A